MKVIFEKVILGTFEVIFISGVLKKEIFIMGRRGNNEGSIIVNDINKFTLDFYMWYHSIIRRYHIYEQPQIQHRSRSALATR